MSDRSTPWWAWGCADDLTPGDLANMRRFHVAILVWLPILAATVWVIRAEASPEILVLPMLLLAVVATLAVGMFWVRFVNGADELTRKLQLEAMAKGFLLGLASALTVPLMQAGHERLAGPYWVAEVLDLLEPAMVMPLTYMFVLIRAQRRMRG